MTREQKEIGLAWAALAAGAAAWFVSQQAGADLAFSHCHATPLPAILICLLALALAGAGAFLSHRVWDRAAAEHAGTPFTALIGMLTAGLLAVAIVYQIVAVLIIPSCFG